MLDATALYPRGFHPTMFWFLPDLEGYAKPLTRVTSQYLVKYYFIDFDLATCIPPGEPKRALGTDGQDQDVPELSSSIAYDPFKVDIYILGNFLKQCIYDVSQPGTHLCSFVMLIIDIEVL